MNGRVATVALIAVGLCQSSATAAPAKADETFAYASSSDQNVRASVASALTGGQSGYLPKDRHWVQVHIKIENRSRRPVQFVAVREQLDDGSVIAGAAGAQQLAKAPTAGGTVAKTLGFGVAGQVLGSMIFPPLALVAGAGSIFGTLGGVGSWNKRIEQINAGMLAPQEIATGTNITGDVYLPAAANHRALIAFYTTDGRSETLLIPRQGTATGLALAEPPGRAAAKQDRVQAEPASDAPTSVPSTGAQTSRAHALHTKRKR